MKKIKYLLLFASAFLLTGCVKFNATMDIKKDIIEEKDKKELESKGFTVSDYDKDDMKGVTLSNKIKNIDLVSSKDDTEFNISGLLSDESKNNYIFKVKKGLLKNTYTAKFTFDASEIDEDDNTNFEFDSDEIVAGADDSDTSSDTETTTDFDDVDFSKMMSNLDLEFNVNLPYPAKSNNASSTGSDNKNLTWNLTTDEVQAIEFQFELYNMPVIYAGIASS